MSNLPSNSRTTKRFLSIVLALSLIASMVPALSFPKQANAVENEEEQITSLNDVEHGVQLPGRERTQEEIEELQRQGCIVDFFDASDIDYKYSANAINTADLGDGGASETLPEKVDLRNSGKVTSVKSQGYTSTCWSWGTTAAAETSIANSTGQAATSYSPFQFAYFGYTPLSSNTAELKGTEKSQAGEGVNGASSDRSDLLNIYGDPYQVTALMMQGTGPATEQSIPFPTQSLQDGKFYEEDSLTADQRRQSVAQLSRWNNFGSLITTETNSSGQTSYIETDEAVLSKMKQALAGGNAIVIGYYADTNADPSVDVYFKRSTSAQYTYKYEPMNHIVCVVGYDDNYSKENFVDGHQPEKDGAFIVKNSWGTTWGDEGYFYLSYYDQSIVHASALEFDCGSEQTDDEEIVDQYDYLQRGRYLNTYYNLENLPDSQAWYSNIYTASQKQSLHRIATYALNETETIGYKVYKLKSDAASPKDVEGSFDSPVDQGTLEVDDEGFVSIELDKPLNLRQGEKYAIWFYQAAGNGVYNIPQYIWAKNMGGCTSTTVVNEQESFYSCNPTVSWDAMTSNVFSGTGEYAQVDAVQDNYCVKGYSTSLEGSFFVDFNSNGGTEVDSQVVADGGKVTKPAAPTKEGATFAGWYKDAALTQPFNFDTETVSADITLYAAWEYDITYELDGGTNADTNPEAYIAGIGVTSFSNPMKTGYTFDGWWSKNGKTSGDWGTKITSIDTAQTGDVTLYAKWSAVKETASGNETSGTTSDKATGTSSAQTGDNQFKAIAVVLAVAAAAFVCASYASRRKSQPKHTKH